MAKILVVDDEMDVGLIVSERLRRNGHEVDYASDGGQAFQNVRETLYDLLILDVHMPKHTGYEVCMFAKESEKNARTPVLLISAFPEEQATWRRNRADAFLAKPFETGKLAAVVEHLLRGNDPAKT